MRRAGLPDLVRAQFEKSAPGERFVDLSMGVLVPRIPLRIREL